MRREYPDRPIVGVSVLVLKEKQALLVRRGREPRQGVWQFPGGVVELGETVRAAAVREIAEECQIEIAVLSVLDVLDRITHDLAGQVQYHFVLVVLLAHYTAGELRAGADIDAATWVDLQDLEKYELPREQIALAESVLGARD